MDDDRTLRIESMGMFINTILGFVEDGAGFVLNLQQFPSDPPMPPRQALLRTFAFGVANSHFLFFINVDLYYLGIMQWVVKDGKRNAENIRYILC